MIDRKVKKALTKIVHNFKERMFLQGIFVENEHSGEIKYDSECRGYSLRTGMTRKIAEEYKLRKKSPKFRLDDLSPTLVLRIIHQQERSIRLAQYEDLVTIYPAGIYVKIFDETQPLDSSDTSDARRLFSKLRGWAKSNSEIDLGHLGHLIASDQKVALFGNRLDIHRYKNY